MRCCDCHGAVVTIAKYASCQNRRNNPLKRELGYNSDCVDMDTQRRPGVP